MIQYFYTLCDTHHKSSHHLLPYKDITIYLAILYAVQYIPMIYLFYNKEILYPYNKRYVI